MSTADDQYELQDDGAAEGISNSEPKDNDYASRSGQYQIPVQKDEYPVTDPIDPATADSDEILAKDDADAIDKSNIIQSRTRGAKPSGGYAEPGDEEGLPGPEDGTSSVS